MRNIVEKCKIMQKKCFILPNYLNVVEKTEISSFGVLEKRDSFRLKQKNFIENAILPVYFYKK
ncbi:hypothetical protein ACQKMD_21900, partial [Viridibacillus sp. NPDC096237]|uniref:hypothetical protein n=1 Tax=Viridibacillus sp. NPDC096237 TaxID=3390721 RepID=UPI003D081D72